MSRCTATCYQAVSCLGALYRFQAVQEQFFRCRRRGGRRRGKDQRDLDSCLKDGSHFLLANEGQEVMRAAGIGTPKSRIAKNLREAVMATGDLAYPLVMKVVSRDIIHKKRCGRHSGWPR